MANPNQGEAKPELASGMMMTPDQLKDLLTAVVSEMKKPSAEEQEKRDRERQAKIQEVVAQVDAAQKQEEQRRLARLGCPHQISHLGRKFSSWVGQVNADNCARPTCHLCKTEMPKVRATVDQIRDGMNFGHYEFTNGREAVAYFEQWHKRDFPAGCSDQGCYLCHPKDYAKTA